MQILKTNVIYDVWRLLLIAFAILPAVSIPDKTSQIIESNEEVSLFTCPAP